MGSPYRRDAEERPPVTARGPAAATVEGSNIYPSTHGSNTMSEVEEVMQRVRPLLREILDLDEVDTLTLDTSIDDLGLTSIDLADLSLAVEQEFSVKLSDEELGRLSTVGDLAQALASQASQASQASPQ